MKDIAIAIVVTLVMAVWTFVLYSPSIGIDDANIVHVYAANVAAGHGYVYNPGGEWVEGSTSAFWTLINVVAFLAPGRPENWLATISLALSVSAVALAMRLARQFAGVIDLPKQTAAYATAAAFTLFPAFFVWSVWSLMDLALWVAMLTWMCLSAVQAVEATALGQRPRPLVAVNLVASSALAPLARPEGAALVAVVLAIVFIHGLVARSRDGAIAAAGAILAAVVAVAGITASRLAMFGDPLPNTVYAKVSTGWSAQIAEGAAYLLSYLADPIHSVPVALVAAVLLVRIVSAGTAPALARDAFGAGLAVLTGFIAVVALVYGAAGGDHFASHRFLQPLTPILAGAIGVAVAALAGSRVRLRPIASVLVVVAVAAIVILPRAVDFAGRTNELGHNFRIAEENRLVGSIMNGLSWKPSVAMIAAGGFAFAYDGTVYDLVGLNWREMAHAVDDLTGTYRNHGGFDKAVFYRAEPDIILPRRGWCTPAHSFDRFEAWVLKGLADDEAFRAKYGVGCYGGLVFHARRDVLARYPEIASP
ncbi:MAG TPA: hypothetical protein VMP03_04190 [Methylomirabilota bacterium]|nr:hypothetical protein [Methylomirabilota bacterium]